MGLAFANNTSRLKAVFSLQVKLAARLVNVEPQIAEARSRIAGESSMLDVFSSRSFVSVLSKLNHPTATEGPPQ
jgi:hypothetical protein